MTSILEKERILKCLETILKQKFQYLLLAQGQMMDVMISRKKEYTNHCNHWGHVANGLYVCCFFYFNFSMQ